LRIKRNMLVWGRFFDYISNLRFAVSEEHHGSVLISVTQCYPRVG